MCAILTPSFNNDIMYIDILIEKGAELANSMCVRAKEPLNCVQKTMDEECLSVINKAKAKIRTDINIDEWEKYKIFDIFGKSFPFSSFSRDRRPHFSHRIYRRGRDAW
jgi:hypothetical protein